MFLVATDIGHIKLKNNDNKKKNLNCIHSQSQTTVSKYQNEYILYDCASKKIN